MSQPSQYLGALVGDIASAFQIPGGSVLGQCIQDLFKKRLETARNILLEEIRQGTKDVYEAHEVDDVVAIVYRYMRAAQEGSARTNLRLLARIIAGQKAEGSLKASDFLYYADIIGALRREEIILLGTYARELQKANQKVRDENLDQTKAENVPGRMATKIVNTQLVPSPFSSGSEIWATANAVSRTGLMTIAYPTFDGPYFTLTPIFERVSKLASFENLETEAGSND